MDFVQNNLLLIATALISGAMLLWPLVRRGTGGPWASTLDATRLINQRDAPMLDVRDPAEFAAGHVLGARNIPLAQIEARSAELEKWKTKPVIVYCESGGRANSAMAILKQRGFAEVYNLSGGYPAWQQAGLPVEK